MPYMYPPSMNLKKWFPGRLRCKKHRTLEMYPLKVFLPICHTDYKGAEDRKGYDNTDWEQGPTLLDK